MIIDDVCKIQEIQDIFDKNVGIHRTIKNTENTETPKHAIQTANPGMVKVELKT